MTLGTRRTFVRHRLRGLAVGRAVARRHDRTSLVCSTALAGEGELVDLAARLAGGERERGGDLLRRLAGGEAASTSASTSSGGRGRLLGRGAGDHQRHLAARRLRRRSAPPARRACRARTPRGSWSARARRRRGALRRARRRGRRAWRRRGRAPRRRSASRARARRRASSAVRSPRLARQEADEGEARRRQPRADQRRDRRRRTGHHLDGARPPPTAARTSRSPGSEMPGMPASEISATSSPAREPLDQLRGARRLVALEVARRRRADAEAREQLLRRARVLRRHQPPPRRAPAPRAGSCPRGCRAACRRRRARPAHQTPTVAS